MNHRLSPPLSHRPRRYGAAARCRFGRGGAQYTRSLPHPLPPVLSRPGPTNATRVVALQSRARAHGTRVSEEIRSAVDAYLAGITADELQLLDTASRAAAADLDAMRATLADPDHTFERPMFWRMKHKSQRALRDGRWKYLKVDEHEYLFDIDHDARERANQARRQPERLAAMRQQWEHWAAGVPPIAPDATVSLVYSLADMPAR